MISLQSEECLCTCSVVSNSLRPHGLYSLPRCSVHEIFQARILEWVAISHCPRVSDAYLIKLRHFSVFFITLKLSNPTRSHLESWSPGRHGAMQVEGALAEVWRRVMPGHWVPCWLCSGWWCRERLYFGSEHRQDLICKTTALCLVLKPWKNEAWDDPLTGWMLYISALFMTFHSAMH